MVMIKEKVKKKLATALKKINLPVNEDFIDVQPPKLFSFGDYSTSLTLKLAKIFKKNPMEVGAKIKQLLERDDLFEKIDLVPPGFVNFWLSRKILFANLSSFGQDVFYFPSFFFGKNKKILVEYAQPNTHKLFHIGHLRNIILGEAISRIFESLGNQVIRVNYQGDVGLHIAKCLWALKKEQEKEKNILEKFKTLEEKIKFIGKMYNRGTKTYEEDEKTKQEIIEINKQIYQKDKKILDLWQKTRHWSLDYFEKIYRRVDTQFDRLFFESEMTKQAIEISLEALKKGILERSQGAVVFNGRKYGLDTRVFINSLGYPTYEGKELALAKKEFSEFGEIDKAIHLTTPEQKSFFKVTFKVEELLDPEEFKDKQYHLSYEWVKIKEDKMSSRKGNIIEANWLIDEVKKKILKDFKIDEKTAEKIAVASVKYTFLKTSPQNPISFDIQESISLKGHSAPYLIYTYIRAKSVLKKEKDNKNLKIASFLNLNQEEKEILRFLILFPEAILNSAVYFSPHFLCQYLYELSQKFNFFYEHHLILKEKNKNLKTFRLLLTQATANVIKKGLFILGIKTIEKM